MQPIARYQQLIADYFATLNYNREPQNLYQPVNYILSLGGKRIRPVLTLMAADVFGADFNEALPAAVAVEVFHNFSLVHDDIMDDAPLRRGKQTVHEKWDINTGILSGDAMLILAYQNFEVYSPEIFHKLAKLFSKTALEVCEGQQWDVDFEKRTNVTEAEYLKMIEYKTAVLLGAAMQMGGIVAETTEENCKLIYDFGRYLGIAFQLQDDYLDAFGDPETFGKQVGGDIIENKKTYLYLKAKNQANPYDRERLLQWFAVQPEETAEKVADVKAIFVNSGADVSTRKAIENYTLKAFETLDNMNIESGKRALLRAFGEMLMKRNV